MQNQLVEQSIAPESLEEDEISFGEILHTLRLRRRLILAITLMISILGALVVLQIIPLYKASVQLMIGAESKVVNIQSVMATEYQGDSAVLGEIEVLKSRNLARRVIEALNLDNLPEFNSALKERSAFAFLNPKNWVSDEFKQTVGLSEMEVEEKTEEQRREEILSRVTDVFLSKLTVSQVRLSQVVNIEFESESPQLAARIANKLADQYIVSQLEAQFEATKNASDWLNGQLAVLKEKVEESERAIELYRQQHGISQLKGDVGVSEQQLSEISTQLIIARTQRAEAEARLNQMQRVIRQGGEVSSITDVLNSTTIQNLKLQETELQRKYSEMSVEFGKLHPQMVQLEAEIKDIQAKMQSEIKKIAASLKNELDVARTRENSLLSSMRKLQQQTGGDREAEVGLRALQREADANRSLYETFLLRYKETSSAQNMEETNARVISKAEVPLGPYKPKTNLLLTLCVTGGLIVAVAVVFILEMLNQAIRSPEQVEEHFHLPTLGIVPALQNKQEAHEFVLEKPHSALTEAINSLRVSLLLLSPDEKAKKLLVTSAVPAEGKSTLALLIARISAQAGQKVVLIDTDFRRPTIEKKFNLEEGHLGLTDLLLNHELSVNDVLYTDEATSMKMLPHGGGKTVNPADMFASIRMQRILEELQKNFDLIIFDSPPIMPVTDSRVLSRLVDKTLFVVRWDKTPRNVVKAALQQIAISGANNVAGLILQMVDLRQYNQSNYGETGYYYHYGKFGQYYSN